MHHELTRILGVAATLGGVVRSPVDDNMNLKCALNPDSVGIAPSWISGCVWGGGWGRGGAGARGVGEAQPMPLRLAPHPSSPKIAGRKLSPPHDNPLRK